MADFGGNDGSFRQDARRWIEANFPSSLAFKDPLFYQNNPKHAAKVDPDFVVWRARVVEQGWGVPNWSRDFGGAGLSIDQGRLIGQEMARVGAFNPVKGIGTMMLGPTLMEYGSEAQKDRFLTPIARGEELWCQGFSEPEAGSDLASLQTKAEDLGDSWRVTGQKIWTSGAHHADWCFCLVRTDKNRKQGGISFLLIDMRSPGIEVRPIILISGSTHFCEVFFDGVQVPKQNILGPANGGWGVAKRLMLYERDNLAEGRGEGADLAALARAYVGTDGEGRVADADLRVRLIANGMRAQAFTLTTQRKKNAGSKSNDSAVSVLKNLGSEVAQERAELTMEILGDRGLGWTGDQYAEAEREATRAWLHSRAFSIYGGTYEVQANITAKRVLGLPDPQ